MQTATLCEMLSDDTARVILGQVQERPRSAKQLQKACDSSLKTIYRRLEDLQRFELVSTVSRIDDEGNHYTAYTSDVEQVEITLEPSSSRLEVTVTERDDVDRFIDAWKGLQE